MPLVFSNPGEIDPAMFKTFGVSAKDNENAIGFFGTGLKYAIAIVLRDGGKIQIYSGLNCYDFGISRRTLRNKDFNIITCNGEELGFTTEIGKTWEPWMAYRELYSNTIDEGGCLMVVDEPPPPAPHTTTIVIESSELIKAHMGRQSIFLESTPIHTCEQGEIHQGASNHVYYRGIRVMDLKKPSIFTYNITHPLELTEDRTVKNYWNAELQINYIIAQINEAHLVRRLYAQRLDCYERSISFPESLPYTETFLNELCDCYRSNPSNVPPSLVGVITNHRSRDLFNAAPLSAIEQRRLNDALEFCAAIGFSADDYKIKVVETMGPNVLALANPVTKQIIISKRVFHSGLKQLCSTLIEEIVHIREGLMDNTREMQTFLFDYIATMGETITGRSL